MVELIKIRRFGAKRWQNQALNLYKVYLDYYNRVISVMEGKLKKEELLKVIGQMEVIEKLPKQLLDELCRVFKV